VPPRPGFLERLRELATEHGAVLIFDEVKTGVVIAYGGAVEYFGVQPDLFCLAKSIGGGVPIGAFGGRDEVMRVIEGGAKGPAIESGMSISSFGSTARVAHMGTMNGSPLVMAAALAILTKALTPDVYPRLQVLGDRLTAGSQAIVDEFGLPAYAINVGPKGIVMFTPQRVSNYRDLAGLDEELWASSFFYLANRGILLPPAPDDQWTLSIQHTAEEVDRYLGVFRDWAIEVAG
jgi:glutamate-1-semialdehyde 2,1-aminomutase